MHAHLALSALIAASLFTGAALAEGGVPGRVMEQRNRGDVVEKVYSRGERANVRVERAERQSVERANVGERPARLDRADHVRNCSEYGECWANRRSEARKEAAPAAKQARAEKQMPSKADSVRNCSPDAGECESRRAHVRKESADEQATDWQERARAEQAAAAEQARARHLLAIFKAKLCQLRGEACGER